MGAHTGPGSEATWAVSRLGHSAAGGNLRVVSVTDASCGAGGSHKLRVNEQIQIF